MKKPIFDPFLHESPLFATSTPDPFNQMVFSAVYAVKAPDFALKRA